MRIAIVFLAAALGGAWAQDIKMPPSFDKLAAKAKESVDVTLDSNMLQMASKFLSDKDADQAKAKQVVGRLKGITVRNFEFDKEGEYSMADVDALREELKAPGWSRIVGVTSKSDAEKTEIYLKGSENGQIGGLVVIDAEPKELTVVNLSGTISIDDLTSLEGQFGIPDVVKQAVPKSKGKDEE
jgi:hypothetical protein